MIERRTTIEWAGAPVMMAGARCLPRVATVDGSLQNENTRYCMSSRITYHNCNKIV
jgi:hypothetical protein